MPYKDALDVISIGVVRVDTLKFTVKLQLTVLTYYLIFAFTVSLTCVLHTCANMHACFLYPAKSATPRLTNSAIMIITKLTLLQLPGKSKIEQQQRQHTMIMISPCIKDLPP